MLCPNCGQENTGNYCSNCGIQLQPDSKTNMESHLKKREIPIEDLNSPDDIDRESSGRTKPTRENQKKPQKSQRVSRSQKSSKASAKAPASDKRTIREMRRRDTRINHLETEVERLNAKPRSRAERNMASENNSGQEFQEFKEAAVKGAAGITVFCVRLMQLASGLLMAYMTWLLAQSFRTGGQQLGSLSTVIGDRNYQLALYIGVGGCALFFGAIWTLWILSRKDGGGSLRLKKYDTGRGFIPFLLCLLLCFLVPVVGALIPSAEQITGIPQVSVDVTVWQSLAAGAAAAVDTIERHRLVLFSCSTLGLILSTVRKLLRV